MQEFETFSCGNRAACGLFAPPQSPKNFWGIQQVGEMNFKEFLPIERKLLGKKERDCNLNCADSYFVRYQGKRDLINAPTSGKSSLRAYDEHGYKTTGNHPVGVAELVDLLIFLNLPTTEQNIQAKPPNTQTSSLFTKRFYNANVNM